MSVSLHCLRVSPLISHLTHFILSFHFMQTHASHTRSYTHTLTHTRTLSFPFFLLLCMQQIDLKADVSTALVTELSPKMGYSLTVYAIYPSLIGDSVTVTTQTSRYQTGAENTPCVQVYFQNVPPFPEQHVSLFLF